MGSDSGGANLEVVGLVPMAGRATRLAPLPFSKELYPAGVRTVGNAPRTKVVSHHLLDQMQRAGVRRAFLILRDGKWDIPAFYGDGRSFGETPLGYLMAAVPDGLPFSLDAAAPFVQRCVVAMGFPDILIAFPDALHRVIQRRQDTGADVALGLFPWDDPLTDDMVEVDGTGRVTEYVIREPAHHLAYTWALAAWAPRFTAFIHDYVRGWSPSEPGQELVLGRVLTAALAAGLVMQSVTFPDGGMLDVGTPEGLAALPAFLAGHPDL